jgi:hypothetical protein
MGTIITNIRWADNTKELADHIQEGLNQIEAMKGSTERLVKALGGEGLFRAAHNLTAAIDQLGGVMKLTTSEQERSLGTLDRAIAKYQAMGKEAPSALVQTADALRQMKTPTDAAAVSADRWAESLSKANHVLGALGLGLSIGAVIQFGREVLNTGDNIQKMSDQTGIGTVEIQKLQYIAGQSGTSIESLVGAVQNLQQRLGDETTGAAGAMAKLKINADAFNRLDTYSQMTTLADAIKNIHDPTEQASLAAALFGKTWKEILPAIKAGMKETGDQATTMADQTTKSLDRIGDTLTAAKQRAIAWGGSFVLAIEGAGYKLGDFLSRFDSDHFGTAHSELLKLQTHLAQLGHIMEVAKPPVLAVNEGIKALGLSAADAALAEKRLTESARASIAEHEKQAEKIKKTDEAAAEWRATIDECTRGLNLQMGTVNLIALSYSEATDALHGLTGEGLLASRAVGQFDWDLVKLGEDADVSFRTAAKQGKTWEQNIGDLSGAFAQLAQIAGGTFGGILKGIGEIIGGFNVMIQTVHSVSSIIDFILGKSHGATEQMSGEMSGLADSIMGKMGGAFSHVSASAIATAAFAGTVIAGIATVWVGIITGLGGWTHERLIALHNEIMEWRRQNPLETGPIGGGVGVGGTGGGSVENTQEFAFGGIVQAMALGGVIQRASDAIYAQYGRIIPFPGRPRGTDTVPVWATPGEGVLSRSDMSALGGPAGFNALRASLRGGGGGATVISMSEFAAEQKATREELKALRGELARQSRRVPEQTAIAVQNAIAKSGGGRR